MMLGHYLWRSIPLTVLLKVEQLLSLAYLKKLLKQLLKELGFMESLLIFLMHLTLVV
jgi:hypothetical protein